MDEQLLPIAAKGTSFLLMAAASFLDSGTFGAVWVKCERARSVYTPTSAVQASHLHLGSEQTSHESFTDRNSHMELLLLLSNSLSAGILNKLLSFSVKQLISRVEM